MTLVLGCSQLFVPMTTSHVSDDSDNNVQYSSQSVILGCLNPVFYEEGRIDEDERLLKKMIEPGGFTLPFLRAVTEFPTPTSTPKARRSFTQFKSVALTSRVLRL